jgi:hypothetical protein
MFHKFYKEGGESHSLHTVSLEGRFLVLFFLSQEMELGTHNPILWISIKQSLNPCNPHNKSRSTLLSICPRQIWIRNQVEATTDYDRAFSLPVYFPYNFQLLKKKKST